MVASTHWLASAAGMAVLEQGGNAFDAAVAAGLTLQVVEPHLNGPGGDLPALDLARGPRPAARVVRARPGSCRGDDRALSRRARALADPGHRPARGGRARRVRRLARAAPRARDDAASRRSCSTRSTTRRRAIPILPQIAGAIRNVEGLFRDDWTTSAELYLPVPEARTMATNPQLAETYRRLAASADPVEDWYRGWVAEEFVAFQEREWMDSSGERHAGLLSADDLATWEPRWEEPLSVDYHGYEVFKAGPWSQAPVFLQQLRLLEGFDLAGDGPELGGVHPHDHGVREARVRRSRGVVRRPGLHRRAARDAPLARVRGGTARAAWATSRRPSCGRAARTRASRRPSATRRSRRASASRRVATPSISTSSTAGGTWSPRRRAAAGSGARRSSRRSASASARARRCSGSRTACRTRSRRASARARRSRRRWPPAAASRTSRRHAGRRPAGSVDAPHLPRPRPFRTRPPGRDRRAEPPHGGVPVELLPARDPAAARRGRGSRRRGDDRRPPRARPRSRGLGPVEPRPRQRRRPRAGRRPQSRRKPARRAGLRRRALKSRRPGARDLDSRP